MCRVQRSSEERPVLISNPYCKPHQIVPSLDVNNLEHAVELAKLFKALGVSVVKIGPELINTYGYEVLYKALKPHITFIFLDLKLHGTPDSLLRTLKALRSNKRCVRYLTVMPDNGFRSVEKIVKEAGEDTKILIPIGLSSDLETESVAMRGRGLKKQNRFWLDEIALASGAHGIVCGKKSLALLKRHHQNLLVSAVGILLEGDLSDDHTNPITPAQAVKFEAQLLIVGRPLIGATLENTKENFEKILSNANSSKHP